MGLFGGFKATFSRNRNNKRKSDEIVCIKYRVNSEFDAPSSQYQVKTRIVNVKRTLSHTENLENHAATTTVISKSKSLQNLSSTTQENRELPPVLQRKHKQADNHNNPDTNGTVEKRVPNSSQEYNQLHAESVQMRLNSFYSTLLHDSDENNTFTDNDYEDVTPSMYPSDHNNTKVGEKNDTYNQRPSSMVCTAQLSSLTIKNMETGEDTLEINMQSITNSGGSLRIASNQITTSSNDKEEFKVNIVQHATTTRHSSSEDEQSPEDEPTDFTTMEYSSQAASIFFGGGMDAPTTRRPRRILFNKNEQTQC